MDITQLPYRLRTARQKKRLLKTDRDKQLLALNNLRDTLTAAIRALPVVPLKEPYQKGWKRTFALREDVQRSGSAAFYETLLTKINTVEFSSDKAFKTKKRKHGRKIYVVRQQHLRAFALYELVSSKCKLDETERRHFHWQELWDAKRKVWHVRFVFNEPWRYITLIRPHIITHARMIDSELEQQLQEIKSRILTQHLQPRISALKGYRFGRWKCNNAKKYKHSFKNTPLHVLTGIAMDEQTTT